MPCLLTILRLRCKNKESRLCRKKHHPRGENTAFLIESDRLRSKSIAFFVREERLLERKRSPSTRNTAFFVSGKRLNSDSLIESDRLRCANTAFSVQRSPSIYEYRFLFLLRRLQSGASFLALMTRHTTGPMTLLSWVYGLTVITNGHMALTTSFTVLLFYTALMFYFKGGQYTSI